MPKRTEIHSVLIIGAGPIIIGQACEFDYSGTQACKALKEEGYRVILLNSNPATIMTDPEFADRTYIEPITPECLEKIIVREIEELKRLGVPVNDPAAGPSGVPHKLVLLPTLGGQTALNTAMALFQHDELQREDPRVHALQRYKTRHCPSGSMRQDNHQCRRYRTILQLNIVGIARPKFHNEMLQVRRVHWQAPRIRQRL